MIGSTTRTATGLSRRAFLAALAAAGGAAALSGCGGAASPPGTVRFWGQSGDLGISEDLVLDAFAATDGGRGVTVRKSSVPSNGTGDATNVITAVRGGTAPDLWFMDRFSAAQYAALGLLEPIDAMIGRAGDDVEAVRARYLPFAVDELTYQGELYGLPTDSDSRVLFYNRAVLRDAGIDPAELDEATAPPTVARITEMSDAITTKNERGDYTRLGLIPWDGEGWGYTWSVGCGATFFDAAACTVDLTAEPVLKAYEFLYDAARRLDFPRVDAFKATYEPPNHPPAQTSFFGGQQGFVISGNFQLASQRKYVPDLDVGTTYLPVFAEGDAPYTWSGGGSLVCPRGSSLSPEVWALMSFYTSAAGQAIYAPRNFNLPTDLELLATTTDPVLTDDLAFFIDQLDYSTSRPPFPVSQLWWDSMSGAQQNVMLGSRTAREALEAAQARVAPQMELYCPFQMPTGYGAPKG